MVQVEWLADAVIVWGLFVIFLPQAHCSGPGVRQASELVFIQAIGPQASIELYAIRILVCLAWPLQLKPQRVSADLGDNSDSR